MIITALPLYSCYFGSHPKQVNRWEGGRHWERNVQNKIAQGNLTNQYGVPMKDFLFNKVCVNWAAIPKSAKMKKTAITTCNNTGKTKKDDNSPSPSFTSPSSVRSMLAPYGHKVNK